jgi:hypothetical protein
MSYFLGKTRPQGGAWFVGFAGWLSGTLNAVGRHNMDNDTVFMASFVFPPNFGQWLTYGSPVAYVAGVSSPNTGKGYWSAGAPTYSFYNGYMICGDSPVFPQAYDADSNVRRVTFSSDTMVQLANGLNTAISGGAVANNSYSKGYYCGGMIYTFQGCYSDGFGDIVLASPQKIIQSINYSDETTRTLSSTIPTQQVSGAIGTAFGRGGGDKDKGYQLSGWESPAVYTRNGFAASNVLKRWKTKLTYSNETTQSLSIDSYWNQIVPYQPYNTSGQQFDWWVLPEQSVFNSRTHLYHVVRKVIYIYNSPGTAEEYIAKMSFSTETYTPLTMNNNLRRSNSVSHNGLDKGYMLGGTNPADSSFSNFSLYQRYYTSLDEIDFATDTWRYTINNLSQLISTTAQGTTFTGSVWGSSDSSLQSAAL